jgi:peptidoglycan/LPS O-acetylase OafA/YrhL
MGRLADKSGCANPEASEHIRALKPCEDAVGIEPRLPRNGRMDGFVPPESISNLLRTATLKEAETRLRYPILDLIRGVAACAVAASHWRNLFFKDYEQLPGAGVLRKGFYGLCGLGHQAVIVFFVLSGFVICNSIHTSLRKGTWSWRQYLVSRLTRLWVVLVPAIILGVALDNVGIVTLPGNGIYGQPGFGHILTGSERDHLGAGVILGNLLFLQTILVPTLGSNSPLWSLANEFWYYMSFPLLVLSLRSGQSNPARILQGSIGIFLLVFAGWGISSYFSIWLMGCGAYYAAHVFSSLSQKRFLVFFSSGCLMTLGLLLIARGHSLRAISDFGMDFVLGLAIAVALFGAASIKLMPGLAVLAKAGMALAKPSYSLYVLHLPFFIFVASRLFKANADRWNPDVKHLLFGLGIAICCMIYVVILYLVAEARTDRVRAWVSQLGPHAQNKRRISAAKS